MLRQMRIDHSLVTVMTFKKASYRQAAYWEGGKLTARAGQFPDCGLVLLINPCSSFDNCHEEEEIGQVQPGWPELVC